MLTRRQFFSRSGLALFGAAGTCLAFPGASDREGDEGDRVPDGSAAKGMITPKTDKAIDSGLAFLKANQMRDGQFGTNQYMGNTAVTSLCALAFMAAGHQPNRGKYGRCVTQALQFVLSKENVTGGQPGFLHNPHASPHGPMYGHGFATLFLAEVSGMVANKELSKEVHVKLRKAVKCILESQNGEGGWRYQPFRKNGDADISVTICQIMALRRPQRRRGRVGREGQEVRRIRQALPGQAWLVPLHGAGRRRRRRAGVRPHGGRRGGAEQRW